MSHRKQWIVGGILGIFTAVSMIVVWENFRGKENTGWFKKEKSDFSETMRSVRERFTFAPYLFQASTFTPKVSGDKVMLNELSNLKNFEHPVPAQTGATSLTVPYVFTPFQKQSLAHKNFFVSPVHDLEYEMDPAAGSGRVDDWTSVYERIGGAWSDFYRAPENAPFVTTDYVLHVYHRLLEKEFEHAEQTVLFDHVHSLAQTLFTESVTAQAKSSGEQQKSLERLSGYFLVPLILTEAAQSERVSESSVDTKVDTFLAADALLAHYANQITPTIQDQVRDELRLIYEASAFDSSPLLGEYIHQVNPDYFEDYTQFGPRSHYAKNSVLRSYFRSMMWFGRQNFLAASPELTRDALTITRWMQDPELKRSWETIYIPTTFFVGESDDLGLYEYQTVLDQLKNPNAFNETVVTEAQGLIKAAPAPQILSSVLIGDDILSSTKQELLESTRGFRFMGQRFTPDAFILNKLTKGDEQGPKLPSTPTALMVMVAFGDKTSDSLLEEWITKYDPETREGIHSTLNELKQRFAALPDSFWGQNIYWGWTRTLKALFQETSQLTGYPFFMQNEAWRHKDTQAALGSWTELKHDTLLYAKQSYAEMGGGGDDPLTKPAVPKGYVEPNIEFWDRLIALSQMTYQGMNDLGLLDQIFQGRNEQFLDTIGFFRSLALQEIENKVISDADFERLRREPARLKSVVDVLPGEVATENEARSALIADVHTDVPGKAILYEANGKPNSLFVAVKDANGARLTRGLVYAYYEFTGPIEKRLTDENWRAAVYGGAPLASEGGETIPFPLPPTWTELLK